MSSADEPPASSASRSLGPALLKEIAGDHVMMVAAGLAFYGVFGLLPATAGAAALWGRLGDLDALRRSAESGAGVLPQAVVQPLEQFVTSVPQGFGGGLGLAVNLALVVWTSYRAAGGLLTALNIVYDVAETRGRLHRSVVALMVGLCGIALLFAALALSAVPPLLAPNLPQTVAWALLWMRWPAMGLVFALGLLVLFRYAPARDAAPWRPVAWGAVCAAVLWIATSVGVSLYVDHVGSFGRLYGSLGSVAVILVWFYASALAILAGAEIDSILAAPAAGRSDSAFKAALRHRQRAPANGRNA